MAEATFPYFCRTGSQAGSILTSTVSIYKQCIDPKEPAALLKTISYRDQLGSSGVTIDKEAEYTEIISADSTKASARLFASNAATIKVNVQRDAFDPIYTQLEYGLDYDEDPDNPGWVLMEQGDQLGKAAPRYSVSCIIIEKGQEVCRIWAPDCELMISGRGALAAGQVYKHELSLMPQVFDEKGSRMLEWRPTSSVRLSVLPV